VIVAIVGLSVGFFSPRFANFQHSKTPSFFFFVVTLPISAHKVTPLKLELFRFARPTITRRQSAPTF
jgi:hypothetical protein